MTYSIARIEDILNVESAALPAVDNWTVVGDDGADVLAGSHTFSDGSWPRFSSWVTWTDITLLGDAGDDTLDGGDGDDRLYPGPGDDGVLGGTGTDAVAFVDGLASVTVDLASGFANENGDRDTISDVENVLGSGYGDQVHGDDGSNVLDGWGGDDAIHGRGGGDDLRGGDGADILDGGGDADTLLDGEGNDTLLGGDGDDTLLADAGDDTLEGGADDDLISGGSGADTASYASAPSAVVASLLLQGSTQNTGGAGWDELSSVANLRGGEHDDWLFGDGFANTLEGQGGVDHLIGNSGDDTLRGGLGDDVLTGGQGIDRASYFYATGGVAVSLTTGTASGAQGSDTLAEIKEIGGGAYADALTGDGGVNTLLGAGGDDLLRGGPGNDTLDGGIGTDTASWWLAPGAVTVNLATGRATGAAGTDTLALVENAVGTDGYGDTLTGDASANRIEGGDGDDNIYGREGDDTLDGGEGVNTANYWDAPAFVYADLSSGAAEFGGGHDTLAGFENLAGSGWGDQLIGDDAANGISGAGGDDTVVGLGGADVLTGGTGPDIFWYDVVLDADDDFAAIEEITDFTSGTDVINLANIDTDTGAAGDQAFTFIGTAAFSDSGVAEVRFDGGVVYADSNGDGDANMAIALTGAASVAATDFML